MEHGTGGAFEGTRVIIDNNVNSMHSNSPKICIQYRNVWKEAKNSHD